MTLAIQALVALAVALLRYVQGREDLRQTAFDRVSAEDARLAVQALEWKAAAAAAPGGGADLRVRESAGPALPGPDPGAGGGPDGDRLPH